MNRRLFLGGGIFIPGIIREGTFQVPPAPAVCQGRLAVVSSPATTLYFTPYKGSRVIWGAGDVTLSGWACSVTNAGLAASTIYYAYLNSTGALELSPIGHAGQPNGDRTKIGDPTRLLVGMVYTDSAARFRNETGFANVISYHNRLPMFAAGVGATVTTSSPTWSDLGAASQNLIELLTWGYELGIANNVTMGISGGAKASGRIDVVFGTVGLGPEVPVSSWIPVTSSEYQNASGASTMGLPEGHHVITLWARAYGGGTAELSVNTFAEVVG